MGLFNVVIHHLAKRPSPDNSDAGQVSDIAMVCNGRFGKISGTSVTAAPDRKYLKILLEENAKWLALIKPISQLF